MRPVVLALAALLLGSAAQASDLKLATWNLNWLTLRPAGDPALPADVRARGPEDFDLLRRYALALAADVIAFQEVDGSQSASRVFTPDRYDLYLTSDEVVQRVGFAVRKGLHAVQNADLVPRRHRRRASAQWGRYHPGLAGRAAAASGGAPEDGLRPRTTDASHRILRLAPRPGGTADGLDHGAPARGGALCRAWRLQP
jgi:hypothetical protein